MDYGAIPVNLDSITWAAGQGVTIVCQAAVVLPVSSTHAVCILWVEDSEVSYWRGLEKRWSDPYPWDLLLLPLCTHCRVLRGIFFKFSQWHLYPEPHMDHIFTEYGYSKVSSYYCTTSYLGTRKLGSPEPQCHPSGPFIFPFEGYEGLLYSIILYGWKHMCVCYRMCGQLDYNRIPRIVTQSLAHMREKFSNKKNAPKPRRSTVLKKNQRI